jgi:hypothetical protein
LWMFQRVMFGKVTKPENENLKDINWREKVVLIPLILAIFWIGIYPKPFFNRMEPSVKSLIENAQSKYEENKTYQTVLDEKRQEESTAFGDLKKEHITSGKVCNKAFCDM